MSDTVIKVENLGKLYKLGEIGTGTLSHDLNRWWARIRGKEDPFAKVGQINDRTQGGGNDYVWALRDINFEVKQGEVLGIIGRNGAGKSTLLKILSKVTSPTTGNIKIRGRIASLLEVGTGFHPELTGRENIYLNGAILGMTKAEILKKFDEIVDFAGIERYIDTPVKRYSSGMYVRLAFSVAAYLEPEILIVDEVLAVGDVEFQKKCIRKIKDISLNNRRTIIFVSHDLNSISQLCSTAILISNGINSKKDSPNEIIKQYQSQYLTTPIVRKRSNAKSETHINEAVVLDAAHSIKSLFIYTEEICVKIKVSNLFLNNSDKDLDLFVQILDSRKRIVFSCECDLTSSSMLLKLRPNQLVRGLYSLSIYINIPNVGSIDSLIDVCAFEVIDNGSLMLKHGIYDYGVVFGKYEWENLKN